MTSRNHDTLVADPYSYPKDVRDPERAPHAVSLRMAIERIMATSREEAMASHNNNIAWDLWPEDDAIGTDWKIDQILSLFGSRPATGAVTDFLQGNHTLHATGHVKIIERDSELSYSGNRHAKTTTRTTIYPIDEIPEKYRDWPIPCSKGHIQILPLYTFGVGD